MRGLESRLTAIPPRPVNNSRSAKTPGPGNTGCMGVSLVMVELRARTTSPAKLGSGETAVSYNVALYCLYHSFLLASTGAFCARGVLSFPA